MTAHAETTAARFFFIHVMKTGGTTFVIQARANFDATEVYPNAADRREVDGEQYGSIADLLALTPERKASTRFFSGHYPYVACELVGVDVVTMTLLRDPVDRIVSHLKQFKRRVARFRDATLEEVYADEFVFTQLVENVETRTFALAIEDAPQTFAGALPVGDLHEALHTPDEASRVSARATGVITIDDERFARACSNLDKVDVVGLTERYAEFTSALRRRFGWWPGGARLDTRTNVSTEPWDVTPSFRRKILSENAYDAEFYRYASELVAVRDD